MKKSVFSFLMMAASVVFAAEVVNIDESALAEDENLSFVSRRDSIPEDALDGTSDTYFEGYIQALVDMHFYEYKVVVLVKERTVWLANMPKNSLLKKSIVSFVKDVPGVDEVNIVDGVPPKEVEKLEKYVNRPQLKGIWFPQSTDLYPPMLANPRAVLYSIEYRWKDDIVGDNAVQVSLGDDFPFYRWLGVWPWGGDLQIGIEACAWSVFDMDPKPEITKGTALVNTDFYVGIPLVYAVNQWAHRFRIYHISSHLGDEFLVNHPGYDRLNPSYEAIDYFISYQGTHAFRVYLGPGFILHSDNSFPMKRLYVEYGGEVRFLGHKMLSQRLYGTFFAAVFFTNWQFRNWDLDGTYMIGYEWSKLQGIGRKARIVASYHHGFSEEGQFAKDRTSYGTCGLTYGF